MLELGGKLTVSAPEVAVNAKPTNRCSILNECVTEPGLTNTADAILAASGVCTWNVPVP